MIILSGKTAKGVNRAWCSNCDDDKNAGILFIPEELFIDESTEDDDVDHFVEALIELMSKPMSHKNCETINSFGNKICKNKNCWCKNKNNWFKND